MEVISRALSGVNRQFGYSGKGSQFAIIFFKNMILTAITLGLYYPWAKVEILKYYYQSAELDGSRFTFHGTGKEVFKGFIKVYGVFILLYLFMLYGASSHNPILMFSSVGLFYAVMIMFIPFAIHGAVRYRSSRSSWRGIHFKYTGERMKMFGLCLKGFLLTILTFGIYGSWFEVSIRQYILSKLKLGNLSFDFSGTGGQLFWVIFKGMVFSILTFGIYMFWFYKNLYKFYFENIKIYQDGNEMEFEFKASGGDIAGLLIVNMLMIMFTFGLAAPWVTIRTFRFLFNNLVLAGDLSSDSLTQFEMDDYDDASGDDFLDFLDFDFL